MNKSNIVLRFFNFFFSRKVPLKTTEELKENRGDYFIRQRRNLFSLSVGLTIFELAGGDIVGFTVLAGSLEVARPVVIYIAAYIGLIYFAWRYWRFAPPLWQKLKQDRNNIIIFFGDNTDFFSQYMDTNNADGIVKIVENFKEKNKVTLRIRYSSRPRGQRDDREFVMDADEYKKMKRLANIRVLTTTDTISEVGLPYLLFIIALLVGFTNNICDVAFLYDAFWM